MSAFLSNPLVLALLMSQRPTPCQYPDHPIHREWIEENEKYIRDVNIAQKMGVILANARPRHDDLCNTRTRAKYTLRQLQNKQP